MRYTFIFGNTPELSQAELRTVFSSLLNSYSRITQNTSILTSPEPLSSKNFEVFGGIVKVGEVFSETKPKSSDLSGLISRHLEQTANGLASNKITFGISQTGLPKLNIFSLSQTVKENLKKAGFQVRFITPEKGKSELSSVVIVKQKVTEIQLISTQTSIILAQTIWTQDFEDWNARDYQRPAVSPHIGMLPPKVARMMVNIGLLEHRSSSSPQTILDPFCGVGTILAEAMMVGCNVIGVDSDTRQIERTKRNLNWLKEKYKLQANFNIFTSDARNVSKLVNSPVDAIVTEPYLGPNDLQIRKYSQKVIEDLLEELVALYLDCLSNWKSILKKGAKIVLVLPSFTISKDKEISPVKMVIDKAQMMGYSLKTEPISYFRPQAIVKRNICIFELNSKH